MVCWGRDADGRLFPPEVPELTNPTQVSAGRDHACALDDTGVVCWGTDYYGESTIPELTNPTQV